MTDDQATELRKSLLSIVRVFLISERRFPVSGRNARYSPHDFQTLSYLADKGSARAGELCRFLEIAPTTMTGVIDRLEAASMISRGQDDQDARASRLELTDTGWEMHGAIVNQDILNVTAMLGALEAEERHIFMDMTQRIAQRIEQLV